MSSRSPQSRRTYAGSRSWSLDHHQRPMHVLRSRCHGSVPFDPASPLGKERMVRAVPRDRAGSLAATIADFCNKICHLLPWADALPQKTDPDAGRLLGVVFEAVVPVGGVEPDLEHGVAKLARDIRSFSHDLKSNIQVSCNGPDGSCC